MTWPETPVETPETLGSARQSAGEVAAGGLEDQNRSENRGGEGLAADLFENFSAEEAGLIADAAPFRKSPMPIGGSRKGVPNRRTIQMRELYLKAGFPHPVLWMGQMLRLGIDGLMGMGYELEDAGELLRKIAVDLAPYIEGKQPTRVAIEAKDGLPVIVFGEPARAVESLRQARAEGALAIDDDVEASIVRYQRLSEAERAKSHGAKSHDEANPLTDQDD